MYQIIQPVGLGEVLKKGGMTTKEVAEDLGCEVKMVLNNAKLVLPNKVIENGKPTYWTESRSHGMVGVHEEREGEW
jgi:hypothetical protein